MKTSAKYIRNACLGSLLLAVPAFAATIPFSNDFSSTGFSTESGFSQGGGTYNYSKTGTTTTVAYGTEQFDNQADNSFTASYIFSLSETATAAGDATIAFGLFARDSVLSGNATNPYLLADYTFLTNTESSRGRLRLFEIDGSNVVMGTTGTATPASGERSVDLNTTYTLKADVQNTASNTYDITLGLFDAAGTTQIGSLASVAGYSPHWSETAGGFYLGVRSRLATGSGTTTMALDDFAVIPEPGTLALVGIAFGLVVLSARRKRG